MLKVHKTRTCWLWTAHTVKGYGEFYVDKEDRKAYAHRWIYKQLVGPIPDGHGVLHHCDTPVCVRPSHLYTGTQKDNVNDMFARGRAPKRYGIPGYKHTEESKKKISEANKGKTGRKTSEEVKRKLSIAHKNRWKTYVMSETERRKRREARSRQSPPMLGKKMSTESKKLMSEIKKRYWREKANASKRIF